MSLPYSLVVATLNRPGPLDATLTTIATQANLPVAVIVVDASSNATTAEVCTRWQARLPMRRIEAEARSAARQRNQGAQLVTTPLVAFVDDDLLLSPDTMEKMAATFSDGKVGGVAGRMAGLSHTVPSGLLWCYYRLQAGYSHPHYGGRVIGPGINFQPVFDEGTDPLIPSEWLNSGLVVYRRDVFEREKFPAFDGYSFLEDAHLSYRVGRTHRLYFRRDALYVHQDIPSTSRADGRALARMIVRHQRLFAREVLGLSGFTLGWKLALHRAFQTIAVWRRREPDSWRTSLGFWET